MIKRDQVQELTVDALRLRSMAECVQSDDARDLLVGLAEDNEAALAHLLGTDASGLGDEPLEG
jgi:hypothetical protein